MNLTLSYSIEACFPGSTYYRNNNFDRTLYESTPRFRYFPYRERHLQCLWADPRHRPLNLMTSTEEPIEVIHAGDWNLEAGPDFLNAVLLVGKEKRRISGDLEIHIHPGAWQSHGHADNPNYDNVRFHIVYFPGNELPGLLQIPLQKVLSQNPCFSFENIDSTAYPYAFPAGSFPLHGMHPDQKTQWLESAGEERLRIKAERFALAMQSKDPDQVLWEELLAALGYKNNKAPFRHLANLLPLARLRAITTSPDETYALLLGLSGLLPANPDPKWNMQTRTFHRSIWDCWWKQGEELKESAMKRTDWTLHGTRPANHPIRRLMAAAHYAFSIPELVENERLLTSFPSNYWETHLSWKTTCKSMALVGELRANAMITNILVPWRAAALGIPPDLSNLPAEPSNSIIRQTAYTLFGPDHALKTYRSALARQGLIQVFHDHLLTHRLDELHQLV